MQISEDIHYERISRTGKACSLLGKAALALMLLLLIITLIFITR